MKKLRTSLQENRNWSTVLKMVLIGVLLLVFLIPLQMIRALIEERNMTRLEAEGEIIGMWGGQQIVAGPVVVVPYLKRVKDEKGKIEEFKNAVVKVVNAVYPGTKITIYNRHTTVNEPLKSVYYKYTVEEVVTADLDELG